MAAKYNLQPNEVMLLKDDSVMHGSGFFSNYTDELILTNMNLVVIKKGTFGNSKGMRTLPLNQVKVFNQQAQASMGKASNGTPNLEVYFLSGQEEFAFQSGGKKKINEWIAKINEAVTGEASPVQQSSGKAIPGADLVADVVKDTFGVFASKFGAKPATPVKVAGRCQGCGAPVSGLQGQAVACEYCGSNQQL